MVDPGRSFNQKFVESFFFLPNIRVELDAFFPGQCIWQQCKEVHGVLLDLSEYAPTCKEHIRRVTRYAKGIARFFYDDPRFETIVEMACLAHDRKKKDWEKECPVLLDNHHKATDAEYVEHIEPHARLGAELLLEKAVAIGVDDTILFSIIYEATLNHHKKFTQLESASLLAFVVTTIVTLADSFDAMTTRPYNVERFCNLRQAIIEVNRCMGTQFNPMLLDAFSRWIKNEENIIAYELGLVYLNVQAVGSIPEESPLYCIPPVNYYGRNLRPVRLAA